MLSISYIDIKFTSKINCILSYLVSAKRDDFSASRDIAASTVPIGFKYKLLTVTWLIIIAGTVTWYIRQDSMKTIEDECLIALNGADYLEQ